MSREVRRVPLDFDFPLDKTWSGYLRPRSLYGPTCLTCYGRGTTAGYEWVMKLGLLFEDVVHDLSSQQRGKAPHPYIAEMAHHPYDLGQYDRESQSWVRQSTGLVRPDESFLEFLTAFLGPDGDVQRMTEPLAGYTYRVGVKLIETAGFDLETWGKCRACDGHGDTEGYEGQRADYAAWEPTEPPQGDGWQLWQTVSEGGPISPVFETAAELAQWMASPAYTWGASKNSTMTFEQAMRFVQTGWAPSAYDLGDGVKSGEFLASEGRDNGDDIPDSLEKTPGA